MERILKIGCSIRIDTTDEIIELSKDIITKGLNLTKENLQKNIYKKAIVGLTRFEYEKQPYC